jgi:hypothetical protein
MMLWKETTRILWARDDDGLTGASTEHLSTPRVGIVAAVDYDKGQITLVHRGGVQAVLNAHPSLLTDVRLWGPVQVVTEGTIVRVLRCL